MDLVLLFVSAVLWITALALKGGGFKTICVLAAVGGIAIAIRGLRDDGRKGRRK